MTQTLTEYLTTCGAPPLPKDWTYHVFYKQVSKTVPATSTTPERERITVHYDVTINDQSGQEIGRGFDLMSLQHSETLGGLCINKAAHRAYHSLFRKPELDFKTVISYF